MRTGGLDHEAAKSEVPAPQLAFRASLGQERLELPEQVRQVLFEHQPDFIEIHYIVAVDEPIPHPGDEPLGNGGVLSAEYIRKPLDRFAQHHKLVSNR